MSSVDGTAADTRTAIERWEDEVRDPARASADREAIVRKHAAVAAIWEISPIPGGWATRYELHIGSAGYSGTPWAGPIPSRQDALEHAVRGLLRSISRHLPSMESDESRELAPLLLVRADLEADLVQEVLL